MAEALERREHTHPKWERAAKWLGSTALCLAFGGSIGAMHYDKSEIHTEIAATEVTISPNLTDDWYTVHTSALGDARAPAPPLGGLDITIGASTIPSGGMASDNGARLVNAYAAVAAQPDAEITKVAEQMRALAWQSTGVGIGCSLLPVVGYAALGARRRNELYENNRLLAGIGLAAVATAALCTVVTTTEPRPETQQWKHAQDVFPILKNMPEFEEVEISDSATIGLAGKLVNGGVAKYHQSIKFYDAIEAHVRSSPEIFHQPGEDQTVALVVSDRHDNIGMDPILRATADMAGATILINAGDDTSAGQSWEEFSLRSLTNHFEYSTIVAVGGNHDNGPFVIDYFKKAGVITPNDSIQTVDGITMLLANDPRRSDYTPERVEGPVSFADTEAGLVERACNSAERVNVVVVHDANMASDVLDAGCADLVIGGHTHTFEGPTPVKGPNNERGYSLTNGTSGGASFSFALGPLTREASSVLVTFEAGKPVGVQHVAYSPKGAVTVGDYLELSPSAGDDIATTTAQNHPAKKTPQP